MFLLLPVGSCGSGGPIPDYIHDSAATDEDALPDGDGEGGELDSGYTVNTTVLLTGAAARVDAGPMGEPQGIEDLENGISQWGPVQAVHEVTIGGEAYIVNQLASPDPFTATYQLESGAIVVSNEPVWELIFDPVNEVDPPTILWIGPDSTEIPIADGEIVVTFIPTATEQQIAQFIQEHNLHVIMSWFEPQVEPANGNEIAWFEFEFDQLEFPTFDAAYAFFDTHALIEVAVPNFLAPLGGDYTWIGNPNDALYTSGRDLWINRLDIDSSRYIPYWSYGGTQQVVAIIDDGVYRNHEDLKNILAIGVDTWHKQYRVDIGCGSPNYWDDVRHRLTFHGTAVAAIVNAATNNDEIGIASCAPGAMLLPIRLKVDHLNEDGVSQYKFWGTFSKAIRALRFQFSHSKWTYKVRVVNMSFGGDGLYSWWWSVKNPKWNLSQDLAKNDRLYIASAGNDNLCARRYPAAHSNVLGVTGLHCLAEGQYSSRCDSNWYWGDVYPISGIYSFSEGSDSGVSTFTPYLSWTATSKTYLGFEGTSAAAPQVSALAFHLYSHRPEVTYQEVWHHIVESRNVSSDQTYPKQVAGVLDFDNAILTWWE